MSPEDAHEVSGHASTPTDGPEVILEAQQGVLRNEHGRIVGTVVLVPAHGPNRHVRRANAVATRPARNPHPSERRRSPIRSANGRHPRPGYRN